MGLPYFLSLNLVDLFVPVYLVSLSVIHGAKSWNDIKRDLITRFIPVMKVCVHDLSCSMCIWSHYLPSSTSLTQAMWLITPPSILFAQNFLSPEVCGPRVLKSTANAVTDVRA